MKRLISFVIAAALLLSLGIPAAAIAIGTVVNHTLYTDIVAEIDGHPLRSYNVDNHTVIVAEDLRAYGFHAIWHQEERWLEVVRPVKDGEPQTPASYPDFKPSVPAGKIGTPAHDILYTDIVTTVAGDKVDSWNIDGETVIPFRELERYGQVLYDNETRRAMYVTEPYKVFAGGHADEQQPVRPWDVKAQTTDGSMTVILTPGEDSDYFSSFVSTDKSDVNMDLLWKMETDPAVWVTLAFYPGQFPTGESLRHDLYDTLCALPIPSMTETIDGTNTPQVREAVAEVFGVTLNGKAVSGDLFRSQGNGHIDFTFLFDKGFTVKPGDTVTVTVSAEEAGQAPQTGTVPPEASAEDVLDMLRSRFLYQEVETIENDLCYVIRGYFSGTTGGNANDLFVVYKTGETKDLTASVRPHFSVIDGMRFGEDPKVLTVTGKVLSEDGNSFISSAIQIDIYTGKIVEP